MANFKPIKYNALNLIDSAHTPNTIKPYNNKAFQFWARAFFERARFKVKLVNAPNVWTVDAIEFLFESLFLNGISVVYNKEPYGLINQFCTIDKKLNIYYRPAHVKVTNAYFDDGKTSDDLTVGEDCELLHISPDYKGISDVIIYYAEKMALLDNALNVNINNSKFAFLIGARNKSVAQTLMKMLDKINAGEPAVVYDEIIKKNPKDSDNELPIQSLFRDNLKNSYIVPEQLQDMQTLIKMFDAEIGITTAPTEKKERMVTDEVNSKKEDSIARCTIWVNTLNLCVKEVNKMFNTDMYFELRNDESEVDDNE